jgi:hypothetical protein
MRFAGVGSTFTARTPFHSNFSDTPRWVGGTYVAHLTLLSTFSRLPSPARRM